MQDTTKIAILGGGQDELGILSEFHRTPGVQVIGIYDLDPRAIALEIAEIVNIPVFSDSTFLKVFSEADFVVVTEKRRRFEKEIYQLQKEHIRIVNPTEVASYLAGERIEKREEELPPWPSHLEEAFQYINRIMDRERLLKWLLEIAVRAVEASSGSIMLYSRTAGELYIGYATGLSENLVKRTRQHLGEGIAGMVAKKREARLISEIIETPLYRDGRQREQIQSAISAPLVNEDRLLGVLNVSTNAGEKKLDESDVDTVEIIAAKIAPILEQHLRIDVNEIRELEFQIRSYLESLFHKMIGFHDKFSLLCRFLADKLEADTVTIYTATDEGDWLILGGSDHQIPLGSHAPRIHCIKGSLARAYVEGEEVLLTEASHEVGFKLKLESGAITSFYMPLEHNEPLGVLAFEFSSLENLERFFKLKDSLRFQVGFFTYSQLHELRQARRMESFEKLSVLTPILVAQNNIVEQIKQLPSLVAGLIDAEAGSFHFSGPGIRESAYYNFPDDESERRKRIDYDDEIAAEVSSTWAPTVLSMLSMDIDLYEKPPPYATVLGFPLFKTKEYAAIFVGYNKIPTTALDSSIFGRHEIGILEKVGETLKPLMKHVREGKPKVSPLTFDGLLKSNQKVLIERLQNEIQRAERYHHGFTLTLFKINGLKHVLEKDYQGGLDLVNELSLGIRKMVRKTDFFSWIEPDLFAVLSLESYQRISYLEERLKKFIMETLIALRLYEPDRFYPESFYTLYPGRADTPAELISEAKSKFK